MRHRHQITLALLIALALLPACSSEQGTEEQGPGGAVQRFYMHLNAEDYDAAKALYTGEALAVIDDPEISSPEAYQSWARQRTHEGTIDRVTIVGTELEEADEAGTGVTLVEFQLHFGDGAIETYEAPVTEENGEWKVGLHN